MRLRILEDGHRLRARLAMKVAPVVAGTGLDDVAKTSLYRPELFGRPWLALLRDVMRGPSGWVPGERELIAAFVSRQNRCHFCAGVHVETASLGLGTVVDVARLDGWSDGSWGPRLTATFGFLVARAAEPEGDLSNEIAAARGVGLSDEDLEDALAVAFAFDLINRVADALDFSWGDDDRRLAEAAALHRLAYRVPAFLLA